MIAADHPNEQLRLAPPKVAYFFDVKMINVHVVIKGVVTAARHGGNDEGALEAPEPHDAPDAQCRIVCMRFDDEHPSTAARKCGFDQFAKIVSQELTDQEVRILPACLLYRLHTLRLLDQVPEPDFGLRKQPVGLLRSHKEKPVPSQTEMWSPREKTVGSQLRLIIQASLPT